MLRTLVVSTSLFLSFACAGPVALTAKSRATIAEAGRVSEIAGADHRGREFSLDAARAEGPVVLIFYRGHW